MSATTVTSADTGLGSLQSSQVSDALVFFGATGDLAYKQIFPALQRMTRPCALLALCSTV